MSFFRVIIHSFSRHKVMEVLMSGLISVWMQLIRLI